jgi:hypothetical protein
VEFPAGVAMAGIVTGGNVCERVAMVRIVTGGSVCEGGDGEASGDISVVNL